MGDIFQGFAVVTLTLLAFIGLVWLREQILHGGGPEWLDHDLQNPQGQVGEPRAPEDPAGQINEEDGAAPEREPQQEQQGPVFGPVWEEDMDDDEVKLEERTIYKKEPLLKYIYMCVCVFQFDQIDGVPREPDAPEIEAINPPRAANQDQHHLEGMDLPAPDGERDVNANNPNRGGEGGGAADLNNMGDDGQWNPMEWDRAAEELTWERLLGLDGSLVFLEHVCWMVSLNTLFILVFGNRNNIIDFP